MGIQVLNLFVFRFRMLYLGVAAYLLILILLAQLPVRESIPFGILLPPLFLGLFATLAAFANPEPTWRENHPGIQLSSYDCR